MGRSCEIICKDIIIIKCYYWVTQFVWRNCIENQVDTSFQFFKKCINHPTFVDRCFRCFHFLRGIVISFSVLVSASLGICSCEYSWDFLTVMLCLVSCPMANYLQLYILGSFLGSEQFWVEQSLRKGYATVILGWYPHTIAMFYVIANLWRKMRNYSYLAKLSIWKSLDSHILSSKVLEF